MDDLIRRWRRVGVWLPVFFVGAVAAAGVFGLGRIVSDLGVVLLITVVTAVGAVGFSTWIFRVLGRAQRETEHRARYLAAINEASLALSSELDLASVLQQVVELSRGVTDARYGALAMLAEDGKIAQFLTSGISREQRARMGRPPEGRGLLGAVIHKGETLRVDRIADDPRSIGYPPHHPVMTSFIGCPIVYEERIVGDVYLTDKNGGEPFTEQDEEMLRTLAAHAAIAIENARLYRQVQDLAVLEERDRIGMDLHDGVIQSIYATGLTLENALEDLHEKPGDVAPQIDRAIQELNEVITDIRSYIFDLRPTVLADTDLGGALGGLLQQLKINELIEVQLREDPGACHGLSEEQITALFHVAQESLTNVRRHARASSVSARLEQRDGAFVMTIADDGVGFDPDRPGGGQGLHNMRERVEALGGRLEVESGDGRGTQLSVELPLPKHGAF